MWRWRGRRSPEDFAEEIQANLALDVERYLSQGMTTEEANAATRRAFGNVTHVHEQFYEARRLLWLDHLRHDVRYALRGFAKSPGFALTAVLTLSIGIGANNAIFSVANAVLLKPLPFPEPNRLVAFGWLSPQLPFVAAGSPAKWGVWREQPAFQDVSAFHFGSANVTGSSDPEAVTYGRISDRFFPLLGAQLIEGRTFTSDEDRPNSGRVVVLSEGFWQRRFGGSRAVIGQTVAVDGAPYSIIGILSRAFDGGLWTGPIFGAPDLWLPLQLDPNSNDQSNGLTVVGRLRPGVTLGTAQAQLSHATEEFRRRYPGVLTPTERFSLEPLQEMLVGRVRVWLLVLGGAVGLVLLIACANVASLLLVRASVRHRELAIRVAIGAGHGRLVRQLLTESVVLALAGALVGAIFSAVGLRVLLAAHLTDLPRLGESASSLVMDWRVLGFTWTLSLAAGLIFGVLPASRASQVDLSTALKDGAVLSSAGCRRDKTRTALVAGELALAVVVVVGAGLLIRTVLALGRVNPGFDTQHVLTMNMSPNEGQFMTTPGVGRLIEDGVQHLSLVPGVVTSSASYCLPLVNYLTMRFTVVGRPLEGPYHGWGTWGLVSSTYFDVFKIPLRRGRLFTERDRVGSPGVVIINETLARQFWPNGDALGHELILGQGLGPPFDKEPVRQIVGIVGDVHEYALNRTPRPTTYVPIAQLPDGVTMMNAQLGFLMWSVRSRGEPHGLSGSVVHELQNVSGGVPVSHIRSMDDIAARSTLGAKLNALILTLFGGSALLLAVVGIYGLMAYSVQQRTREIGIRMALGADVRQVRRMVLADGLRLTSLGVAVGAVAALAVTRVLTSFLFGVLPNDPVVLAFVPLILVRVALVATWVPARRATRLNPLDALRTN
jgi:predicted permease